VRPAIFFVIVALIVARPLHAEGIDIQAQAIAARLRCPVCQNESVADSPAELAKQMRALIREKLAAGEPPDQIIAYFVSRYGEWILLDPPRKGLTWAVWLAPPAMFLVGIALVAAFLRRSVARTPAPGSRGDPNAPQSAAREDRRDEVVDS